MAAQGVTTVTAALAGTVAPLQASAIAQSTVAGRSDHADPPAGHGGLPGAADNIPAQPSTGIQLATAAQPRCTVTAALTTAIRVQATVQVVITASATAEGTAGATAGLGAVLRPRFAALTVASCHFAPSPAQVVGVTLTTRTRCRRSLQAQTTTAAPTTRILRQVLCSVTLLQRSRFILRASRQVFSPREVRYMAIAAAASSRRDSEGSEGMAPLITAAGTEPITPAQLIGPGAPGRHRRRRRPDAGDRRARAKAENYTGTAIISQTWEQTLDEFPDAEIEAVAAGHVASRR